jgi:hypothetical protein
LAAKDAASPGYLAVDGTHVYWTNNSMNGTVARIRKDGTFREKLGQSPAPGGRSTAYLLDAHFVYGEPGVRARRGGGDVLSLTPPTVSGHGVAVEEGFFYTCDDATGRVLKVAK